MDQPVRSLDRESPPGLICSEMRGWLEEGRWGVWSPGRRPLRALPCTLQPSSRGLSELDDRGGSVYPQNPDVLAVDVQAFVGSQTHLFKREICIITGFGK